jgi:hypothetical protein
MYGLKAVPFRVAREKGILQISFSGSTARRDRRDDKV